MLSILIPVYNYDVMPLVAELYDQVVHAGIAYEVIVLDDASANKYNNAAIQELKGVSYVENTANLGRTASRQKLAQMAKYDRLLFLDADVLPASEGFIKEYAGYLKDGYPVVVGGCAYRPQDNTPGRALRYKYGVEREQKTVAERTANPYGSIVSANLLIARQLFLQHNFDAVEKWYGLDIYFSYRLFIANVPVLHIDNPVYHLGLEDDEVFFAKTLQAVAARRQLLANAERIEEINSLLKHYNKLKRLGLHKMAGSAFKVAEPYLRKRILCSKPSLICLDLYRLGYMCSLR